MQKEKNISTQEVISMEEYLNKRQRLENRRKNDSVADSAKRKALPGCWQSFMYEMLIFTVKVVIIPVDQTINQDVGVTHNRHKNRAGNRCFQKS